MALQQINYISQDADVTIYVSEDSAFVYIAGFIDVGPPPPFNPPTRPPGYPNPGNVNVSTQFAKDVTGYIAWPWTERRK
jgi:hypothetical protein